MNEKTRQYLVVGLLVAAAVAVVTGLASALANKAGELLAGLTGKQGASSTTVDKGPEPGAGPGSAVIIMGELVDPHTGGSATVKVLGNTYPVLVELKSVGAPTSGKVRLRATEKPLFDPAQTFDYSWPDVQLPGGGKAVQLQGDMPSMSAIDAPLSAALGRATTALLYFEDTVIGAAAYKVSGFAT